MTVDLKSLFEQSDVVDLTHPISTDIPLWPNDPSIHIEQWTTVERDGYALNRLAIGEHSGTHFGCPSHFFLNGRGTHKYKPEELIVPASVISTEEKCRENPDYALTVHDILQWEREHGLLPKDHLVLMFTNWSSRWTDPENYLGLDTDNVPHFPGFSPEAVKFLVNQRRIVGLGIDTHGIDKGIDTQFEANSLLFKANCFHLENLSNLDKLPSTGSIVFIGVLPILNGNGSPARILAIVPK